MSRRCERGLKARDYMLYAYPVVSADHYAQGIRDNASGHWTAGPTAVSRFK